MVSHAKNMDHERGLFEESTALRSKAASFAGAFL